MKLIIKIILSSVLFASNMVIVFGQNDTIPPKPVYQHQYPHNWNELSSDEKRMFQEKELEVSNLKRDSYKIFNELTNYLVNKEKISGFQAFEAAKLLYQIPLNESLLFLLNNIDVYIRGDDLGGVTQEWKNYPFVTT